MIEIKEVINTKDILEVEVISENQVIAITDYRTVLLDTNILYDGEAFHTAEQIIDYLTTQINKQND